MIDQFVAVIILLLGIGAGVSALFLPVSGMLLLIYKYLRKVFVKGPIR
jgi:hypothetical protein